MDRGVKSYTTQIHESQMYGWLDGYRDYRWLQLVGSFGQWVNRLVCVKMDRCMDYD